MFHFRAQDAPYSIGGALANQFSWYVCLTLTLALFLNMCKRNYDHVASLWQYEKWLPEAAVQLARTHYSGYAVQRADGLRVISLNTNLCALTSTTFRPSAQLTLDYACRVQV